MKKSNEDQSTKRYYLTLTKSKMDKFTSMLKEHNQPVGIVSMIVDQIIGEMTDSIQLMLEEEAKGKKVTMGTMMRIMGEAMDRKIRDAARRDDQEVKSEKPSPKTKKMAK